MQTVQKLDRGYLVMAAFLIALVVPLFVLANNILDFRHLNVGILVAVLAAAFLVLVAIFFMVGKLAERVGIAAQFNIAVRFSFFFLITAGLALPLSGASGQVEINQIPTNRVNLAIALVVASFLLGLSLWKTREIIRALSVAILAISALQSSIPVINEAFALGAGPNSIQRASNTRNIFVLSFDGLSSALTREAIKEHPEIQSALSDFRVFENVASASPATFASITAETSGDRNLQTEFGSQQGIMDEMHKDEIITNALAAEGYVVSTYGTYGRMLEDLRYDQPLGSMGAEKPLKGDLSGAVELYDYALARMIPPKLTFASTIATPLINAMPTITSGQTSLEVQMINHQGADWDKINLLGLSDFRGYVDHLKASESAPVAHFMHFLHTHFPIDLDENCIYRSNDSDWFKSHQNRAGAKSEGLCALRQMAEFIEHLREIGVYDKSMIILKSDHGQPVVYNDPARLESFTVRGHPYWGYARYTPFLAIKGFNEKRDAVEFDARPAILSDLARTICDAAALEIGCATFSGYDLVQDAPFPKGATYILNIVRDPKSSFKIDGHESIVLERSPDFLATLHRKLTLEILAGTVSCGRRFLLADYDGYNNGKSDFSTWATWSDESSTFAMIKGGCSTVTVGLDPSNHSSPTVFLSGRPVASDIVAGSISLEISPSSLADDTVLLEFRNTGGALAPTIVSLEFSNTPP